MEQITLASLDDELSARLHRLAELEGITLNQLALKLLREGVGLTDHKGKPGDKVGSSLDHLMGTWTPEQAEEFNAVLRDLDTFDESAWK